MGRQLLGGRRVAIAFAAAALVAGAALQAVDAVALRARAQGSALVMVVPLPIVRAVEGWSPQVPVPAPLRLVLARDALAAGNLSLAARDIAALPASPDRLALAGALAQAHGDERDAARDELAAGDVAGVRAVVETVAARGALDTAAALEAALVARLDADRTQPGALAQAAFELGRLEERRAWRYAPGSAARRAREYAASRAYDRAAALAPLDERYLLAVANQALNLTAYDPGAYAVAAAAFARANAADPTSADALAGLGDLALRRGDRTAAATNLARARALDPRSDAVRRLARALAS